MAKAASGEKKSVLIVEDSADFANLMKFVIEDMGFEGIQFPVDEEDIVGWAKRFVPAAILMDLALRRKEGMQFIEELKAESSTKEIPVVIITGRDLSQKEVVALHARNIRYLRKGRVEMQEIKQAILDAASGKEILATQKAR
jgi:DNA-binding response OmpR family regulator